VPEVAKAAEEWRKLHGEHAAAAQRLHDLEEARHLAVEADSTAYAVAIRAAKADPGPVATKKADAALIDHRRRVDALEKAVGSAESDLLAAVERHRSRWLAELDQQAGEAQTAYADAVEAVEVSRRRLCEVRATTGWLSGFPGRPVYKGATPGVAGLVARHGDGYSWPEVIAALRADAAGLRPVDATPLVLRPADAA
jgi:hypothetical protein